MNVEFLMNKYLLLFLLMWLLIGAVSGQTGEQSVSKIDSLPPKCFFSDKNTNTLLVKSVEQDSPNSRVFHVLMLCENGDTIKYRYVENWAFQSRHRGKLTTEQIEEIKQMLTSLDSLFLSASTEPKEREKFTTFNFFNGFKYLQHNYSGDLSIKAQQVIDFVKAEIQKQTSISNH